MLNRKDKKMLADNKEFNQGPIARKVPRQILLDKIQDNKLKKLSDKTLISVAYIVRLAIHNFLVEQGELKAPKLKFNSSSRKGV